MRLLSIRAGFVALAVLLVASGPSPARAQDEPATGAAEVDARIAALRAAFPGGLTQEQVDALVSTMDDGVVRAALAERLTAEMAPPAAPAPAEDRPLLHMYPQRLEAIGAAYGRLPAAFDDALHRPGGQAIPGGGWRLVLGVASLVAVGWIAMRLTARLLRPWRTRIAAGVLVPRGGAVARTVLWLMLDAVEVAVFSVALVAAYLAFQPTHPLAPALLTEVLAAGLAIIVTERVARLLFDPRRLGAGLLPLEAEAARIGYHALVAVVSIGVILTAASRGLFVLGLDIDELSAIALPLSPLPYLYLLAMLCVHRKALATAVAGRLRIGVDAAALARGIVGLSAVYLGALWLVTAESILRAVHGTGAKALGSLIIVLLLPFVAWLANEPLRRAYGAKEGDAVAEAHLRRLMRAVWTVLLLLAIAGTAWLWGIEAGDLGLGESLFILAINVALVVLVGYLGWVLVLRWVDARIEATKDDKDPTRAQRLRTLLPLFRTFIQVVLVSMILMTVLSALGVDIGPLLAGAGIVGIAIGFGAQTTVANVLTGVAFLLVDAFRVGDYVEIGSIRGTVEGMSLTTLRLRHQRGAVHTLPFAEMRSITNYSRDWMLMRLEFRVPPETDLGLVKSLVKKVGQELAAMPEIAADIIEPLKSQGVRAIEDNALVLGIKYIARPSGAFTIRREAYQRLLKAFQDNGIEMVGRGVVVRVEGGESVPPHVAGAAARAAVEEKAP